jgi:hypothetical protein
MKCIDFSRTALLLILAAMASASCQKEAGTEPVYGTRFEKLLKTEQINAGGSTETKLFSYDNSGKLKEVKYQHSSSAASNYVETYYRNSAGQPDSIVLTRSAGFRRLSSQFYYTASGLYRYSIQRFVYHPAGAPAEEIQDSSIYAYAGNLVVQRTDYRSFTNGSAPVTMQRLFTYDAAGNLTQSITTTGSAHGLVYEYDTKTNPLPVERDLDYFGAAWYHDKRIINNPVKLSFRNAASGTVEPAMQSEYRYLSNGKPYYRKDTEIATSITATTYYYYD